MQREIERRNDDERVTKRPASKTDIFARKMHPMTGYLLSTLFTIGTVPHVNTFCSDVARGYDPSGRRRRVYGFRSERGPVRVNHAAGVNDSLVASVEWRLYRVRKGFGG